MAASGTNKTVGGMVRLLVASNDQEPLVKDERAQLLAEACQAFEISADKIRLCWSCESIPFEHFAWGNTIFINKKMWQELEEDQKTWAIWHEVAHIVRHHYGMNQLVFGSGAAVLTYLLKNFSVTGLVFHGENKMCSVSTSVVVPGMLGILFAYRTMLRCQEISATRRAAELLCQYDKRDVVELTCGRVIFSSLRSVFERPAWCFPTWKEEMHCLQGVLEQDDLNRRLYLATRTYLE